MIIRRKQVIGLTFGENLRKIRLEKGLSQQELGKRLGVTQQTVAQYEKIKSMPKGETVRRLAEALDVHISELSAAVSIGDNIRNIRGEKHLSQQELADKAGLSLRSIIVYETNRGSPNVENLFRIAAALDVDVRDLYEGIYETTIIGDTVFSGTYAETSIFKHVQGLNSLIEFLTCNGVCYDAENHCFIIKDEENEAEEVKESFSPSLQLLSRIIAEQAKALIKNLPPDKK